MNPHNPLISVVIPCHNEASNILPVYDKLKLVLAKLSLAYEIVYVNDGSTDDTCEILEKLASNKNIRLISFSRNFGKEIALTAGMQHAHGDAIISMDGDGQHPPELIPHFITAWEQGNQVVIGVRENNRKGNFIKRAGSKIFYWLFKRISHESIVPGSTDYRLIDKAVQQEFIRMTEHGRLTRGLIDWLGFKRAYLPFHVDERLSGKATYTTKKLFELAVNSFISLSWYPLYVSLYAGIVVVPLSIAVGIFSAIEMAIGDPWKLDIHGTAFVAILILFSVGILLISQGFIGLYLSRVLTEAQNRPLFVIDQKHSHNI